MLPYLGEPSDINSRVGNKPHSTTRREGFWILRDLLHQIIVVPRLTFPRDSLVTDSEFPQHTKMSVVLSVGDELSSTNQKE
jgi:hypothetical protein